MPRDVKTTGIRGGDLAPGFSPVVVAPTYNNGRTLRSIVQRIQAHHLPLIVVNDGSTDETPQILKRLQLTADPGACTAYLAHRRNLGKAAALYTGFRAARRLGYTHAVTIDTDGQHDPHQLPQLVHLSRRCPTALVIGVRDPRLDGYPRRSLLGRQLSNLMIRLESGVRVLDSQCGMRVYPLALIERVRCRTGRFNFETEVVTRWAWSGYRVIETPITSRYLPPGQRVSHFRPWSDTIRSVAMHVRLVCQAPLQRRQSRRIGRRFGEPHRGDSARPSQNLGTHPHVTANPP